MTKIRLDFVPCLLIGGLLCGLTIFAGQKYVEMADACGEHRANAAERYVLCGD